MRCPMSQSEALPRLTIEDRRRGVINLVVPRGIDKVATAVITAYGLATPPATQLSAQPATATVYT